MSPRGLLVSAAVALALGSGEPAMRSGEPAMRSGVPARAGSASAPGDEAALAAERRELDARLAALRREPESAARLGEEARLLALAARVAPEDERPRLHAEGLAAAEKALALSPDDPEGLLWWSAHRGAQASASRPFEATKIATDVEARLRRLREVAPDHAFRAADRALGGLYLAAPPVVSIGSVEKAEEHLSAALRLAPAYPGNQLGWLALLARKGRCDQVRRGARAVLASRELASHPLDAPGWRREAERLATSCVARP